MNWKEFPTRQVSKAVQYPFRLMRIRSGLLRIFFLVCFEEDSLWKLSYQTLNNPSTSIFILFHYDFIVSTLFLDFIILNKQIIIAQILLNIL